MGSLQESNIDDRVRIQVMLGKGLGAGRLRFPFNTGVFTIRKHTISVANPMGLTVQFSDLPPRRVAGLVSPIPW